VRHPLHTTPPDTGFPTGLLIDIDRSPGARVRSQLETILRREIKEGQLRPGAKLPPTRTLARELGIARSVVVEVYGQLVAEGFLEAFQGAGTRVRALAPPPKELRAETPPAPNTTFATGLPDPAFFPQREWLRAYSALFSGSSNQPLGRPDLRGRSELRTALAGYLSRVRGLRTSPSQLLICDGVSQSLSITARALRARGTRRIGVEDPCSASHRRLLASCGLQPVPVPVDRHGLVVSELAHAGLGAVVVGPAHSFPSGAVLSQARRRELARWAQESNALIIEDDYDAEFRFDSRPVAALQSLAPDHVLYTSSVSKVLDPALRIGWMATPERLISDVLGAKVVADTVTATFGQLALARFIDNGGLARHIRRVRPRYRLRRDLLLAELRSQAPELRPQGSEVGLHLYLPLPANVREADVLASAKQHGLHLEGATRHWTDPDSSVPAVLVGYGTLNESTVRRDVRALVAVTSSPPEPPRELAWPREQPLGHSETARTSAYC
jgi:GntR family transcriptional regulator/MocR family aminotransferase